MTATTITGLQALAQTADELDLWHAIYITDTSTKTSIVSSKETDQTADIYNYGVARLNGSLTDLATVSDYAYGTGKGTFTLVSPGFTATPVERNLFEVAYYNADQKARVWAAINRAIWNSYPDWYRETWVLSAASTITLAAGTYRYALPTDVAELLQVGIEDSTSEPVVWFWPLNVWEVQGEEGANYIYFRDDFPDTYTGEKLCLHYAAREPQLTAESGAGGTTELPAAYIATNAGALYQDWLLSNASRTDLVTQNVNLPQLQARAAQERAKLKSGVKAPLWTLRGPKVTL